MTDAENERLKAEFFARGGKVNVLPSTRVKRSTLKPEIVKKRDMLAELRERAKAVQS